MATVTIGGQSRALRFDVSALSELELRSDKHLGWFLEELHQRRCGPAVTLWLLWAGLQYEAAPPSVQDVKALMAAHVAGGGRMFDFYAPFVTALGESELLRPPKGGEANPPTPEAASPSATSGSVTG